MKRQRQGGWLNPLPPLPPLRKISLHFGQTRPFSVDAHYLHRLAGVTLPKQPKRATPQFWVLSRALYAVRIVSLKDIPADKKSAAISLAAAAWTPFANTTHYIIEQASSVMLCAWDSSAVSSALSLADVTADDVLVLPETALRDYALPVATADNPLALFSSLDGVVATVLSATGKVNQANQVHQIEAEQWWHVAPTTIEWQNFQRSLGFANEQRSALSAPQNARWLSAPVGYLHGKKTTTSTPRERWTLAIAAWLLVIPTLWFANEWRQLHQLKTDALAKLASTERELDATLGARGQAISGLDRVTKISALLNTPDNLATFSLVNNVFAQITQAGTLQLTDWELRGSQLKMSLLAPNGNGPAATVIVKAFEKAQTIRDVEVNVDGSRTTISLKIVPALVTTATQAAAVTTTATAPSPAVLTPPAAAGARK